jgi:hypothetical protein
MRLKLESFKALYLIISSNLLSAYAWRLDDQLTRNTTVTIEGRPEAIVTTVDNTASSNASDIAHMVIVHAVDTIRTLLLNEKEWI